MAVVSLSKIKISKAIHNWSEWTYTNLCCCQSVKDKNFESNSQPFGMNKEPCIAVVSLSKIKISKAIHNVSW